MANLYKSNIRIVDNNFIEAKQSRDELSDSSQLDLTNIMLGVKELAKHKNLF